MIYPVGNSSPAIAGLETERGIISNGVHQSAEFNATTGYTLIDHESLTDLFNISSIEELRKTYRGWVEESLGTWGRERQPRWTESIAVGDEGYVGDVKGKLGIRAMGREVIGVNGSYELREPETSYEAVFRPENGDLRDENTFYWDVTF